MVLEFPKFTEIDDRLPPQNIEAEESVLGGILIDPYALSRITWLKAEEFSIESHQTVYRAAIALHNQGKTPDLMNVTSWLDDRDLLEHIGGQAKLAQLVDRTVSAVNIDEYAHLVQQKAIYRHLIRIATDLRSQAYRHRDHTPIDLFTAAKHQIDALEKTYDLSRSADSDELDFNLLDQQLEVIEAEENSAKRELKMRKLAKSWGMSKKDLLDFHAKWLDSKNTEIRSYSIDEYFDLHGRQSEEWLIDGWTPKAKVILHSAFGGTGKTRVAGSQILSMITGRKWGDYPSAKPRKVLVIQTDQGPSTTAKQLDIQGFLSLAPEYKGNLQIIDNWSIGEFGILKRKLQEFKPDLVLIDSLTSVSVNSLYSENEVFYARPIVRMRHYAKQFGCTFHILHHLSKQGLSRGTTAIYDSVDEVWIQSKGDQPNIGIISIEKSRTRAPGKYQIKFDETSWTWEPIYEVMANGDLEAYSLMSEKIFKLLKQSPGIGFELDEISEKLSLNPNTCRKEIGKLAREGRISSCRGHVGRLIYFYGIYPNIRERSVDPERSELIRDADQPSTSGLVILSADKNRERSDDPQNSIFDHCEEPIKTRINGSTDLSLDQQPSNPEPESNTQLIQVSEQLGSTDQPDQPDHIFKPGDRLSCSDGGCKDLEVIRYQPDSLFLLCKLDGDEETVEFTEQELLGYGYQKQAEPSDNTPDFPSVGDRVYRVPDRRKRITLVVAKVTNVTPSGASTDSGYHISKHCWIKGEWKPAPNPATDLPLPHTRILIEIDGEWVRGSVVKISKRSFAAQGPHCRQYTNLTSWRWPDDQTT